MSETNSSRRQAKSTVLVVIGLAVAVVVGGGLWWGIQQRRNSAESDAIQRLRTLNSQAINAGEAQPVVMQMDAQQKHVATIIVQNNLVETVPLLAKLHHVTEVYLADTDFDDEDVNALSGLPKLNSLILSNTGITDTGVIQLPGSQLHQLHLAGTSISPAAIDVIGRMKPLQVLNLSDTSVQDNLGPLANLEELEWLLLSGCDFSQINDQSIEALTKMRNLGRLTVLNTNISIEVVDRLKAAHPGLNVEADGLEEEFLGERRQRSL